MIIYLGIRSDTNFTNTFNSISRRFPDYRSWLFDCLARSAQLACTLRVEQSPTVLYATAHKLRLERVR